MKIILFFWNLLITNIAIFGQTSISIEEQATKAGKDAFTSAMIRNLLIGVGFIIFYALFKLLTKKEK